MGSTAITGELIWPSQNDVYGSGVGGSVGDGVMHYERQFRKCFGSVAGQNNYVLSGGALPATDPDLTIQIPTGKAIIEGHYCEWPATNITLPASNTSHIFVKLVFSGTLITGLEIEDNTSDTPPASSTKLGTATTSGSAVTSTTDTRQLGPNYSALVPFAIGAGSTRSHEGSVVISANQNLSGIHYYNDFTINSGVTVTVPAGSGRLIILASGTVTINGTISGVGGGLFSGGTTDAQDGASGTDQVGGTGGGNNSVVGGLGGVVKYNGWLSLGTASAGVTYPTAAPSTPATISGSSHPSLQDPFSMFGASSGGASESGADGGYGGASLVIIAQTVILGASSVINLSGQAGQNGATGGADTGGGGGGGSGNFYVRARVYTASGTVTLAGGVGGSQYQSGVGNGATKGGAGAAGWKQIYLV